MKTHSSRAKSFTCGVLAAILCAACGASDSPTATSDESAVAPANRPMIEETTPASAQTQQDIGVSTWHYRLQQDGSARIEGLGADGARKVILRAAVPSVDSDDWDSVIYSKVLADGTEAVLAIDDITVAAFRADVADPQSADVQRDLEALPVSTTSEFDVPAFLERENSPPAGSSSTQPKLQPEALSNGARWDRREMMKCMRRFAGQAYTTDSWQLHSDCGINPTPWNSTDVMKVFNATNGSVETVVIAFAGTRFPNLGDILRDLESQAFTWHNNPLNNSLPALGYIGRGWDARWNNQAYGATLANTLNWYISDAKNHGRRLEVLVVGHSLGAVTATVAGYDIAQYLRGKGVAQNVYVYSFNSPRLGFNGARNTYQDALFASNCPAYGNDVCLTLRQFTRNGDPVQSVPLGMQHAIWQSNWGDRTVGAGSHNGQQLSYCAQLNVNDVTNGWPWTAFGNHRLDAWDAQINTTADWMVDCMFEHRW